MTDLGDHHRAIGVITMGGIRTVGPETLAESYARRSNGGAVVGFDFPIGVPWKYARRASIRRFLHVLPELGVGRWARFYDLAEQRSDISIERPFYPKVPGGTQQLDLVRGLGVRSMNDLLRRCDVGSGDGARACSLFWTLGGNQVGRAAISGWREALVPARRALGSELGVWPFDGALDDLVQSRACVIAETYPADACIQLGLPAPGRGWSKRDRRGRAERSRRLLEFAKGKPIDLANVRPMIEDGFGSTADGEDRFDAVVGLLAMLAVVLGLRPEGAPPDEPRLAVEGWILGRGAGEQQEKMEAEAGRSPREDNQPGP